MTMTLSRVDKLTAAAVSAALDAKIDSLLARMSDEELAIVASDTEPPAWFLLKYGPALEQLGLMIARTGGERLADERASIEAGEGELLAEMPKNGGTRGQGRPNLGPSIMEGPKIDDTSTLADIGLTYQQSHRWQQIAKLPEESEPEPAPEIIGNANFGEIDNSPPPAEVPPTPPAEAGTGVKIRCIKMGGFELQTTTGKQKAIKGIEYIVSPEVWANIQEFQKPLWERIQ